MRGRETCVLFNQSFHMTDMYVEGPDAPRLLSDLGVNSFKSFDVNKAKQYVLCNYDGYVIGDVILFHLRPNSSTSSAVPGSQLGAISRRNRQIRREARTRRAHRCAHQDRRRKVYRYQVQGPNALKVIEKVHRAARSRHQVLQHGVVHDCRARVRALRHGMAGQPGFELFGPGLTARRARRDRRSRQGVRSASVGSARPTRRTRSSPAGFRRRCRPCIRARR